MALNDIESVRGERGLDRLLALSDGVFAFAITLLALDLVLPAASGIGSNGELLSALGGESNSFVDFIISFFVVGFYWVGHNRVFRYIKKADNRLLWLNLIFLFFIVLLPFGTRVLEGFNSLQAAVMVYALINIGAGFASIAMWGYASSGRRLVDSELPNRTVRWHQARGLIAVATFAVSIPLAYVANFLAPISWALMIVILIVFDRKFYKQGGSDDLTSIPASN